MKPVSTVCNELIRSWAEEILENRCTSDGTWPGGSVVKCKVFPLQFELI